MYPNQFRLNVYRPSRYICDNVYLSVLTTGVFIAPIWQIVAFQPYALLYCNIQFQTNKEHFVKCILSPGSKKCDEVCPWIKLLSLRNQTFSNSPIRCGSIGASFPIHDGCLAMVPHWSSLQWRHLNVKTSQTKGNCTVCWNAHSG